MKTLLALTIFLIFTQTPLNSDHYKTGLFFSDPYYTGCVVAEDMVNGGSDCVYRSPKFYFNEAKHSGSMSNAENSCYSYLNSMLSEAYRKYSKGVYELWINCYHT